MMRDLATSTDAAVLGAGLHTADSIRWTPRLRVDKYDDDMVTYVAERTNYAYGKPVSHPRPLYGADFEALGVTPAEVVEVEGNLLTTAGLTRLTSLLTGAGGTAVTTTTARIGVGNSSTAAAVGQTDLQAAAGSGNRWFQIMDATYPQTSAGVVTLRATFATGDGNFVWAECGTDVATATVASSAVVGSLLLNRFVQALGTKASGSWVLTETITFS